VLNSGAVGMPEAAQVQWLRDDLAANTKQCILAYWHHPRFSSVYGDNAQRDVIPIYEALYEAGATVIVASHDHVYERFAPMDPAGQLDPVRGIRNFTVGTGGGRLYAFTTQRPNSEVRNNDTHGIIVFSLHENSYSWEFVPVAGKTFTDSGSDSCR
jgi:acid phosphatase type 7